MTYRELYMDSLEMFGFKPCMQFDYNMMELNEPIESVFVKGDLVALVYEQSVDMFIFRKYDPSTGMILFFSHTEEETVSQFEIKLNLLK